MGRQAGRVWGCETGPPWGAGVSHLLTMRGTAMSGLAPWQPPTPGPCVDLPTKGQISPGACCASCCHPGAVTPSLGA